MIDELKKEIKKTIDPQKAQLFQRFFKTEKGGYGENDVFLGLTVPKARFIARQFNNLTLPEVKTLLTSKFHEERLIALMILVLQFEKGDIQTREKIFEFYCKHTKYINNWDLVDLSAYKIVGEYLFDKDRSILYTFAVSKNIWERRISIVSTYFFIKQNQFKDTFALSELLLNDKEDLMHKAVGWALREMGKRVSKEELIEFLKKNYSRLPRTTLRYAIEHFPPETRKKYLKGQF